MNRGAVGSRTRFVRRPADAAVAVVSLAIVAAGMFVVRNGSVSGFEEEVFRRINDLPGAVYPVLWPFQQLGVVIVGPLVAVAALILRRYRLAAAVLIATAAKLVLERAVKDISTRPRPFTSIGHDIELRGNVPETGDSFVSGHAVLVTALAGLITPYLPGRWKIVPWILVGLVLVARVYVGAHNPLDVICGAALGLFIACVLNLIFGVPAATDSASEA